jgi:multidrug efflux system membrane fusion protein
VTLPAEAYDRQGRTRLATGHVLTLDNRIDPTTGTFRVKATFANADSILFPDQFVNIRLLANTLQKQVVVPSVAVQRGAQGPFVYTIDDTRTARLRQVKTGITNGDETAIASGLAAGDRVVVEGADRLRDGMHVDIRTQDARPPAKAAS